jgi:hypothetical protein
MRLVFQSGVRLDAAFMERGWAYLLLSELEISVPSHAG